MSAAGFADPVGSRSDAGPDAGSDARFATVDVLTRVVRLAMLVRLAAVVISLVALVGSELDAQTVASVVALAATSVVALSDARLLAIVVRKPLLAMLDIALVLTVIVILGVQNPLTLAVLSTALVVGVLYATAMATILGITLAVGYLIVAAADSTDSGEFVLRIGIPVTVGCLVAVGQAIRAIEQQFEESRYRLALALQAAAVGEERGRLARDVHDGIAKSLQGLALSAAALPMWLQRDSDQAAHHAKQLSVGAQEAVREARDLLGQLRADRPGEPFGEVVEGIVDGWSAQHEGRVAFTTSGPEPLLATQTRYELLAALREALTNIARHAPGAGVMVHLEGAAGQAQLLVRDNGPGFDRQSIGAREQQGHFGLRGMVERLESVGGSARIETSPGRGTTVLLTAPCPESAAAEPSAAKEWWA